MKAHLSCLLSALLLSGCLLNQTDPAPQVKKPFLVGTATVEDLSTAQGGLAVLNAQFAVVPDAGPRTLGQAQALGTRATGDVNRSPFSTREGRGEAVSRAFTSDRSRGLGCRKVHLVPQLPAPEPVQGSGEQVPPPASNEPIAVSLGRLGFGPVLQNNLMILEPSEQLRYQAALAAALPAGLYQLVSEETEALGSIQEILSMPEHLRSVRFAGIDLVDPDVEMDLDKNLELLWRAPAVGNDFNAILLEISVKHGDEVRAVTCTTSEEAIPTVSGFKTWTLDRGWFAEFAGANEVDFFLLRAHRRLSQGPRSQFQLQGVRTWYRRIPAAS